MATTTVTYFPVASGGGGVTPAVGGTPLTIPGPTWAATQLVNAQLTLGSTIDFYVHAPSPEWSALSNNSGTLTWQAGGLLVSSTAVASHVGSSGYNGGNGAITAGAVFPGTAAGGKFYASWSGKLNTTIDAQGSMRFCLGDGTDALSFFLDGSVSTTIWNIQGTHGGSAFKTAGTGALATSDQNFHTYVIYGDGTQYNFLIDGVSIGTSNALTAGTQGATFLQVFAGNGTTAAIRSILIEQAFYAGVGNT